MDNDPEPDLLGYILLALFIASAVVAYIYLVDLRGHPGFMP